MTGRKKMRTTHFCSHCDRELEFIREYEAYYCFSCERYERNPVIRQAPPAKKEKRQKPKNHHRRLPPPPNLHSHGPPYIEHGYEDHVEPLKGSEARKGDFAELRCPNCDKPVFITSPVRPYLDSCYFCHKTILLTEAGFLGPGLEDGSAAEPLEVKCPKCLTLKLVTTTKRPYRFRCQVCNALITLVTEQDYYKEQEGDPIYCIGREEYMEESLIEVDEDYSLPPAAPRSGSRPPPRPGKRKKKKRVKKSRERIRKGLKCALNFLLFLTTIFIGPLVFVVLGLLDHFWCNVLFFSLFGLHFATYLYLDEAWGCSSGKSSGKPPAVTPRKPGVKPGKPGKPGLPPRPWPELKQFSPGPLGRPGVKKSRARLRCPKCDISITIRTSKRPFLFHCPSCDTKLRVVGKPGEKPGEDYRNEDLELPVSPDEEEKIHCPNCQASIIIATEKRPFLFHCPACDTKLNVVEKKKKENEPKESSEEIPEDLPVTAKIGEKLICQGCGRKIEVDWRVCQYCLVDLKGQ